MANEKQCRRPDRFERISYVNEYVRLVDKHYYFDNVSGLRVQTLLGAVDSLSTILRETPVSDSLFEKINPAWTVITDSLNVLHDAENHEMIEDATEKLFTSCRMFVEIVRVTSFPSERLDSMESAVQKALFTLHGIRLASELFETQTNLWLK